MDAGKVTARGRESDSQGQDRVGVTRCCAINFLLITARIIVAPESKLSTARHCKPVMLPIELSSRDASLTACRPSSDLCVFVRPSYFGHYTSQKQPYM
jgi:hypothetical protein